MLDAIYFRLMPMNLTIFYFDNLFETQCCCISQMMREFDEWPENNLWGLFLLRLLFVDVFVIPISITIAHDCPKQRQGIFFVFSRRVGQSRSVSVHCAVAVSADLCPAICRKFRSAFDVFARLFARLDSFECFSTCMLACVFSCSCLLVSDEAQSQCFCGRHGLLNDILWSVSVAVGCTIHAGECVGTSFAVNFEKKKKKIGKKKKKKNRRATQGQHRRVAHHTRWVARDICEVSWCPSLGANKSDFEFVVLFFLFFPWKAVRWCPDGCASACHAEQAGKCGGQWLRMVASLCGLDKWSRSLRNWCFRWVMCWVSKRAKRGNDCVFSCRRNEERIFLPDKRK